jgi:hypothetical protein
MNTSTKSAAVVLGIALVSTVGAQPGETCTAVVVFPG